MALILKASRTYDSEGKIAKIIGTAKEITVEKRKEYAGIEMTRRDMTTGL